VELALFARRPRLRPKLIPPVLIPADRRERYPALAADLDVIDEVLVPAFAGYDLDAQRQQNSYWGQQVLLIVIGALTSSFAAVQAALGNQVWPGIVVGALGTASAVVAAGAQERGSLRSYLDNRTKAERLKAAAFAYLAELPPFAGTDREDQLAGAVAAVAQGQEPQ
jgi:hypothetical protein